MIIRDNRFQATCSKCSWKRGFTSVEEVAQAWEKIHDCKEDKGKVYTDLGLEAKHAPA